MKPLQLRIFFSNLTFFLDASFPKFLKDMDKKDFLSKFKPAQVPSSKATEKVRGRKKKRLGFLTTKRQLELGCSEMNGKGSLSG